MMGWGERGPTLNAPPIIIRGTSSSISKANFPSPGGISHGGNEEVGARVSNSHPYSLLNNRRWAACGPIISPTLTIRSWGASYQAWVEPRNVWTSDPSIMNRANK